MPCPRQTFSDFSQDQFDCLIRKGAAAGIAINGTTGQASTNGITVVWDYDAIGLKLELECTESPFFIPCAIIESKIRDLVESCR